LILYDADSTTSAPHQRMGWTEPSGQKPRGVEATGVDRTFRRRSEAPRWCCRRPFHEIADWVWALGEIASILNAEDEFVSSRQERPTRSLVGDGNMARKGGAQV
jgi:hypothetical protein